MCPLGHVATDHFSRVLDSHETPTQVSHLVALPPRTRCDEEVCMLPARWHLSISIFLQSPGLEDDRNCDVTLLPTAPTDVSQLQAWRPGSPHPAHLSFHFPRPMRVPHDACCRHCLDTLPLSDFRSSALHVCIVWEDFGPLVSLSHPGMFSMMTATQIESFLQAVAICHECPPFSSQLFCAVVADSRFACVQFGVHPSLSKSRLELRHFRPRPGPTRSRPLPHGECAASFSVPWIRRRPEFICDLFPSSCTNHRLRRQRAKDRLS